MDDIAAGRAAQTELYGAPLAQVIEQIGGTLGLTQGRIAQVLGLSAPMLSHLVSGRRVKIGNPMAHARLTRLRALAGDLAAGKLTGQEAAAVIPEIEASQDSWTTTHTVTTALAPDRESGARQVQELFRQVADAADWLAVADLAAPGHPEIAELLRTYGASRTATAEAHWQRTLSRP
ncbi:DNA-binding protein [Flexivirga sp. ID2601S]|uniref:DNA-binding protein n=1 Tax=Flexivirga aerilata TaxID=1656889 RepID=A0A849AE08_9MICO|nr:DNA-binding protein [Flexivirga aerilata]NNG38669.1 DNA-binding protein [Flexivirga aerilata]